jgi:hypothetical protein
LGCTIAWLAGGCGPSASDDGDGTGSASAGSTGSSTSRGDASGPATFADVGTAEATTRDGTTGDDTTSVGPTDGSDGTETGEPACAPPEEVTVSFSVDPDEPIDAYCSVIAVDDQPELRTIMLDCEGQPIELAIGTTPSSYAPQVSEGQPVRLAYVTDPIFWINRWLALHTAGGESDWLLLGAVDGSALDPPGTTIDSFFGGTEGATTVAQAPGVCEPLDDLCGPIERIALDFGLAGFGTTRVLDHGTGFVDVLAFGFAYTVQEAVLNHGADACDDLPPAWFRFMFVWFPSD